MGSSCSPQAHPDFYLIGEQEQVSRKTCGVLRTEMLHWEQKYSVRTHPWCLASYQAHWSGGGCMKLTTWLEEPE